MLLRSSKVSLNSVVFGIGGTLNGSISCILWSLALLARKHLFYNESQCQRPEKDLTVSESLSCRGFFGVWIISCNILQSLVFRVIGISSRTNPGVKHRKDLTLSEESPAARLPADFDL